MLERTKKRVVGDSFQHFTAGGDELFWTIGGIERIYNNYRTSKADKLTKSNNVNPREDTMRFPS